MEEEIIRQPIVTICGHVDHGKTSILDYFRKTDLQSQEAGGITQKISFTLYPYEQINKTCPLLKKSGVNLKIPGFLFIDTPGHAAFTNLRKRGGSLADLAILVIDINEGIKPQTAEVIQILKHNKTPFIIALNKVDNISGWRTNKEKSLKESIESQPLNVKNIFDERYMMIADSLTSYGFDSDLFYNIDDFTKKIALIPCSARTGEGIQELMMMLCGLSQKYLKEKLKIENCSKGIILEVKKEKDNEYVEAILYDGKLKRNGEIAIADMNKDLIITKVRTIEEILPLSTKFTKKEEVIAATGLKLQFSEKADILPGMPFLSYEKGKEEEIKEIFKKELTETITTENKGIIAKADSLGSLEALLVLLKQKNIPVLKAGIGDINKNDFSSAKANLEIDPFDAIILGFNVNINEDVKILLNQNKKIKIILEEVVYRLIDLLEKTREDLKKEIEREKLMGLTTLCKLEILHQYVFRITKPAIFGVKVSLGRLIQETKFIDETNEEIGRIKNIQSEKNSLKEAIKDQEVAISIPGVNFEKQLKNKKCLYSDISERQFKEFKKNKDLLNDEEMKILREIVEIKRINNPDWGI
ncbi:translation initiation factor IF-2 [Candidatus Woesearchaeota archaeon]|jgi:translation initiation factor 5B|nr:translation initiation factor IF-2 [Candidatus Woesearchaeota archaeon]